MTARILVVDDEPDIAEVVQSVLEAAGYDASICSNGQQAIDLLGAGTPPDLVLLDVMMPYKNGYEVLDWMREHDGLSTTPVVMMSAAVPEKREGGHPWDAFLRKPFTLEQLEKTIRGALR